VVYSLLVFVAAILMWRIARQISSYCRVRKTGSGGTDNTWAKRALEGEHEAFSISLSFLFCCIARYHITGHMPKFPTEETHVHEISLQQIYVMLSIAVFVLLLSAAILCFFDRERALSFALCASWCFLITGGWLFQRKMLPLQFEEIQWTTQDKLSIEPMAVAVAFTMLFVLLVGLNDLCERVLSPRRSTRETAFQTQQAKAMQDSAGYTPLGKKIAIPDELHMSEIKHLLLESFGTLVGLAWEEAFHGAEHSVIEGLAWTKEHFVISACCMAFLSMAFVLILWRYFIVPKAILAIDEHQTRIEEENMIFLAGSFAKDDEVVLCEDIILSNDQELKKDARGRVVGPPAHYHDSMVKCIFESAYNVSILEQSLKKVAFPHFLGPFDIDLTWFHHCDFHFNEDELVQGAKWEMKKIPEKVSLFLQGDKSVHSVFFTLGKSHADYETDGAG